MKRFKYDVYSPSMVYITTWSDVVSDLAFAAGLNGGLGEMDVTLARNADNFGESSDVAFDNIVIVTAFDDNTNDGVRLFTGYISGYTPDLDGNSEYITVIVVGFIQELSQVELLDNGSGIQTSPTIGNTTLSYASKDPSNILKDIIDKYNALTGVSGLVNYAVGSIDLTGTTVSYTFTATKILDAINECLNLAPPGWYWYLDEYNVIQFHALGTSPNYTLYVKKDIKTITPTKRNENVVNVVYVTGGGTPALFKVYENLPSITNNRRKTAFIVDQRVTVADTAQLLANTTMQPDPETRTQISVIDDNGRNGLGFDIELLKPGKIINVLNFLSTKAYTLWGMAIWGSDVWGYNISNVTATAVPIVKITYNPDEMALEISSLLPQVSHRIEDLDRNWQQNLQATNPVAPS